MRQDAAFALPLLRELPRAAGPDRNRILAALHVALLTDDKATASLIRTAQRLRLSSALDTLLPHYLDGKQPALDAMLLEVIPDIDGDGAAQRLSKAMPSRVAAQQRAVQLLARCTGPSSKRCLQELLTAETTSVQMRAAAALLDHGHPADDIRRRAGSKILDGGRRLRDRSRRLTFRSIRPQRNN